MRRSVPVLAMVLLLCAACASPPPVANPPSATPSPQQSEGPIGLVNLWRVSDAEGERPETWLRLELGQLQLWRDCGLVGGSWKADARSFVSSVDNWSGGCTPDDVPGWLVDTRGYRAVGGGWELVGADGSVRARLSIDGAPKPIETVTDDYTKPPPVTDEVREALRPAAPLPSGATAISSAALQGTWRPATKKKLATKPYLSFAADGSWTGSDGCNEGSGRWLLDDQGGLLATAGPTTLIGCDGAPVHSWVSTAAWAAADGAGLVLYDRSAAVIATLVKG